MHLFSATMGWGASSLQDEKLWGGGRGYGRGLHHTKELYRSDRVRFTGALSFVEKAAP
ncbi:MAG: hypothetical protein KJ069_11515 [Anaerolineae bacterium]|nr:hypothetical protein [Anaerolineae bacterium]